MQTQLLINGRFVDGEGPAEAILNPATGERIASVPEASLSQIEEAVAAADAAFPAWARTTPQERSLKLLQVADRDRGSRPRRSRSWNRCNYRQAAGAGAGRRAAGDRRLLPLLRRCRALRAGAWRPASTCPASPA